MECSRWSNPGQTTKENPTKGNTFIIWEGGSLGDFELTLDYKIESGNSGIQYRSFIKPAIMMVGELEDIKLTSKRVINFLVFVMVRVFAEFYL